MTRVKLCKGSDWPIAKVQDYKAGLLHIFNYIFLKDTHVKVNKNQPLKCILKSIVANSRQCPAGVSRCPGDSNSTKPAL